MTALKGIVSAQTSLKSIVAAYLKKTDHYLADAKVLKADMVGGTIFADVRNESSFAGCEHIHIELEEIIILIWEKIDD